ncbi:MAG TPA: bifunctional (p)ppGpp synthetase/guanosine-3',5'-bis(diphosphate) 3'-pyrophosphohydrolase [Solirubrobacteraceae bacterium]|jgi:guanosine-3',5'-bis(diphosphate) 3'-pyrophosphohydrolase|nr:bifunctional (p)ppGpp synthetase/guanosine-3',5'-bis(diphosphate) 3'-pyrophosphohydrolase [Solirubrobacteraceae bacterium]
MAIAEDPKSSQATEVVDGARPQAPAKDGSAASVVPTGAEQHVGAKPPVRLDLSEPERRLLRDLFAIVSEHGADSSVEIDRERVQDAFVFACEHHAAQRRKSGEDFIVHPVGVARICAGMRLDTETLCAALLHDTVEDTSASIEEVRERFGDEIATIVDGVTKLTGITFQSRDEAQASNYRKMMVAMATDPRVILIKLADRLHNLRTIDAMPKQKQMEKARETLEIYAPLAHRLGIHAIKWELEDLAFATLHPRKYQEIKGLVAQQRDDRERYVTGAGEYLTRELAELGIEAQIAGRAKHFYSIYSKMTKKGREFNEIYDLTAMRVLVDSVKDCYGTVGVIHSLWKPLPGRFKDFIAMPKFNMYQSLHTTVIGPEGRPLEIQIRTHEMHEMAEFGLAAHWVYKQRPKGESGEESTAAGPGEDAKLKWLRSMLDWQKELSDPREFMETFRNDLFEEEVYVFTPKGEVKSLAAGATPLDFAYEVHTEIGHRCVGARVNGKIVPLHYELRSGDRVEILTAKRERGPSRDWLAMVKTTRARNKIKQWFKAESRQDTEHVGRELLQEALRRQGLPAQKITGSAILADVIREVGYRKADDFYIALGAAKVSPKLVVNKVMQRLKQGEAADGDASAADLLRVGRARRRPTKSSGQYGIRVEGVDDVMLRLAKCCRPVPGDEIVGYISLGRGITIHREDCPNTALLRKDPERFTSVSWEGDQSTGFIVEIQIDAWDRHRLLEDLSRVFSESGANIIEARCLSTPPMVKNRFVVEVADTHSLKGAITRLRNTESVFDAYRVTPGGGAT